MAVPVVLRGPSIRSTGLPTTLSWSIGLMVAGVSNFIALALGLSQQRAERPLNEWHLERVVGCGSSAGEQPRRDDLRPARHLGFGRLDAPRLMRHTAQRDAPCPIPLHDGCNRDQRECVRSAVADLAIDLLSTDRRR